MRDKKIGMSISQQRKDVRQFENDCKFGKSFDAVVAEKMLFKTDDGYDVILYPEMIHSLGCIIAASVVTYNMDGSKNRPTIVVDENFSAVPPSIQKWFILHELGHIHCKHLDNMDPAKSHFNMIKRYVGNMLCMSTKEEYEADKYATDNSSVVLSMRALNWLQKNCSISGVRRECVSRKHHVMASI